MRPEALQAIEVYWALECARRPFRMDRNGLWQRDVPAIIAGADTRILGPEDQLLHPCGHLCKHAVSLPWTEAYPGGYAPSTT
jgi:hypothetical protein